MLTASTSGAAFAASPFDGVTRGADYVIAGAGAVGLAFADTLLTESSATMILVDRRAMPGGHWNDAYPFVRLHGPAATYGVESMALGHDRIDSHGLNRGHLELAGGSQICAYFERLLHERLLPSGRVQWLAMHDLDLASGVATSRLDGRRVQLHAARHWVDATRAETQVPATHAPPFELAEGVRCVTPTGLTRLREPAAGYVIVGAGKTAMDSVLWLLQQGVEAQRLRWIRPRDAWLLDRANVQPSAPGLARMLATSAAELEAARDADSLPELFQRLEAAGALLRIDPAVTPTMFRCAIVSQAELAQLRRVHQVVRAGHVQRIERHRIVLDQASIPTSPDEVHVHCSARGLPRGPLEPVFQGRLIVPQYLRRCSPSLSAALAAHLSLRQGDAGDDAAKNRLAEPVVVPEVPLDWLRMHLATARNQQRWQRDEALRGWLRRSRLEAYGALIEQAAQDGGSAAQRALQRLGEVRGAGLARLAELLASAPQARAAAQALPA